MNPIQPLCQPQWTRRLLIVAMSAAVSSQAFALEAITDDEMSVMTGEGIAFLPENAAIRMNGADSTNSGAGTFDTGYLRYIPVGPLTTVAATAGAQKADIFLYGLGISRADSDTNARFGSDTITSWGTATNPWVLKVLTETVPSFAGVNKPLSYLRLESPLYNPAGFADPNQDDYHLKMGLWVDAFMRSPTVAIDDNTPSTWSNGLSNRIRLQMLVNDFSINGSHIALFQTLDGATGTGGTATALSTSYNNTLGMSGTLRFNTGLGGNASIINTTSTRVKTTGNEGAVNSATGYAVIWNGSRQTDGITPCVGADTDQGCRYEFLAQRVVDSQGSYSWTLPGDAASKVLRFSTQEAGTTQGLLTTSAINGSAAPTFDSTEGLYLYNPNINLVLGQLSQPLIVDVADDGQNLVLEVTRIPNQANVYNNIYTDYANPTSTTYRGSTCNAVQCERTVSGTVYAATHSSISAGSVTRNATTNELTANRGAGAYGVSFGRLNGVISGGNVNTYINVKQRLRPSFTGAFGGYTVRTAATGMPNWGGPNNEGWTVNATTNLITDSTFPPIITAPHPGTFATGVSAPTTTGPINNLGSAVIDGILINHLKLTTKGL